MDSSPTEKKVNLLHFFKEISKTSLDQNGGVLENVLEHWVRIWEVHSVQQEPGGGEFEMRSSDRLLVLFKYTRKSDYVSCLLPQPACGAAVVAGGAVEAGPVEGSVPLLGATAAICRNCVWDFLSICCLSNQSKTGNLQKLLTLFKQHQISKYLASEATCILLFVWTELEFQGPGFVGSWQGLSKSSCKASKNLGTLPNYLEPWYSYNLVT